MTNERERVGADYQPNQTVLAKLPQVTLVAVIGPTAVGKTTLMNAAAARCPALHLVQTTTTRQPRSGEEDGIDCHFRSREEMGRRIAAHEYVQVAPSVTGDIYATAAEDYSTDGVAMMAILSSAMPTFKRLPFKAIRPIFVLPPSWSVWQKRIVEHNFTAEQMEKRLREADESLRYAINSADLTFVVNEDLAQATLEFTQAALGASPPANQYASRELAMNLLKELQNRYTL